jgi:hypothetical protein
MNVSIASADFSFQPGEVIDLPDAQARTWIGSGHATQVNGKTPLTNRNDISVRDLDMQEALTHGCVHCGRRAARVLGNKPYCLAHYKAELG